MKKLRMYPSYYYLYKYWKDKNGCYYTKHSIDDLNKDGGYIASNCITKGKSFTTY